MQASVTAPRKTPKVNCQVKCSSRPQKTAKGERQARHFCARRFSKAIMLSICSSEAGPISDPLGGHSLDSTVGVLVRAALPGGVRVRKIKWNRSGCRGELPVQRESRPAVRRDAFYPIRRQKDEQKDHRVTGGPGRPVRQLCGRRKSGLAVYHGQKAASSFCSGWLLVCFPQTVRRGRRGRWTHSCAAAESSPA